MIAFRVVMLFVVAYLCAVVFYSRRDFEPRELLVYAAVRAGIVSLWTAGAFLAVCAIEWAFINS